MDIRKRAGLSAPPTPHDHWSAPAPPSPLQSPPHRLHPTRNSLPYGCADSVRLRITGTARETLTEPERVRPGEESGTVHTHPRLHPASREQTLLRSSGVMSAPPFAPQSATHSGWSERGRCALTDASSPLPSSPASGPHRSSPAHRDSVRLRRPQTLSPKRKTAG